jgi:capsular polysaccharide transport system permease protein
MIDPRQADMEPSLRDFFVGVGIQFRVLHALLIRELMTRYGRSNIGFLWLILEPMILCAGVIGLRWLVQAHKENGISLVALLLSGYMPLTLWRHITNKSLFILRRNMGMLYHRHVTLMDAFVTTMVLEFIGCTLAFIVNYFALLLLGVLDPIQDYGLVIEGWCLMGFLSLGVGSAIAVLVELYEAAERFIQPMQYLILPVSGFLYMADWLPERVRDLALCIPLLHCFEITRHGFFGETVPTHYTVAYPLLFSTVLLAIFLPRFEKVRDVIHIS